jgi:hypothetical protein
MKHNSRLRLSTLLILIVTLVLNAGCYKVIVRSKDKDQPPVSELFDTSIDEAIKAGREALVRLGYKIDHEDKDTNTVYSGWQSAKAASHYIDLFDHRDYGTVGAYYRIVLTAEERAGKTQVAVSAPTRAIVSGRLKTSFREERKVLHKMRDLLRTNDFDITNVGVEEK